MSKISSLPPKESKIEVQDYYSTEQGYKQNFMSSEKEQISVSLKFYHNHPIQSSYQLLFGPKQQPPDSSLLISLLFSFNPFFPSALIDFCYVNPIISLLCLKLSPCFSLHLKCSPNSSLHPTSSHLSQPCHPLFQTLKHAKLLSAFDVFSLADP